MWGWYYGRYNDGFVLIINIFYNLVNLKILKIVIYVFWIEVSLEINVI